MKRGEIYYIQHRHTVGKEIAKGRPAIIVSNDVLNNTSEVVEVVFLTTQPKKNLPTHVLIKATGTTSTALCEQVNTVSKTLVGTYFGKCTAEEMKQVDVALRSSLGIRVLDDVVREQDPAKKVEDLKKAAWYIAREIERLTKAEEKKNDPLIVNIDAVNHPSHYTDGKIEVIDYIEDKGLDYHLGNAVKYISRAGKKDPAKKVEDLKKAAWYIAREIEKLTKAEEKKGMKKLILKDKNGRYNPFEVVEVNDEKWIVVKIHSISGKGTEYTFEPLEHFIACRQLIDAEGEKMTINEYLRYMTSKLLREMEGKR